MNIKELRNQIDQIDSQILKLMNQRIDIVLKIGELKSKNNDKIYVPHREKEIIERLQNQNKGLFPNSVLANIYREIISACRALEEPLTVAYLGPKGSFGHAASIKQFGSSTNFIPIQNQSDIFIEVESGRADYGVVAIENSTAGIVRDTLDMFISSNLQICAEILMPISHNLLSNSPAEKISRIYSHRQPFDQCKEWLRNNFRDAEQVVVSSTSEAAQRAAKEKATAAIASKLAAEIYGLDVLYEFIIDNPENATRFLVIGKHSGGKSGDDKTSVLFSVRDEPGALAKVLKKFVKYGLNLSNIHSRPSQTKAWEYLFFVDIEGHIEDDAVKSVIDELEEVCVSVKFLGAYPKAINDNKQGKVKG